MTIETKFNINDLVQHKFQYGKKNAIAFEVMEVQAICCYTTAQVFYTCRPIHPIFNSEWDTEFKKSIKKIEGFMPGAGKEHEYVKFREDELKSCDEEIKGLILKSD